MLKRNRKKQQSTNARSVIAKTDPKSPVSEQYRTIRTNLQFASIDKELRTIMVTSSSPGEGKTTTISNLAVVLAQQGMRVLLIDADLRKPNIHYTFRCPNTKGLTSVLTKQSTLEAATSSPDVENLEILTSGPIPPNPSELLGSEAMARLLSSTKGTYDIVLIDTPPIITVTDAQVLANMCDGAVLVLSSGRTEVDQAVKAKDLLEKAQAKILGVVLNEKAVKQSQYYYYYGKE